MQKTPYEAPKLVKIGAVSDLTLNGKSQDANDSKLGSNHVTWSQ